MALVNTLIAISLAVLALGAVAGVSMAMYCSACHLFTRKREKPTDVEQAGKPA